MRAISGRYLLWRSVSYRSVCICGRSPMGVATARQACKANTFRSLRAMRAVFRQVLRYWIIVRSSLSVSSSDDQGASKAAFNALVADERTVDGAGT